MYPLVRYIRAPLPSFSLSRSINIGIKNTSGVRFVMATGFEMIFSRGVLRHIVENSTDGTICFAPCGFLREGHPITDRPWDTWADYLEYVSPSPPKPISWGTLLFAARDWWFKIHGYDEEHHPFNYADSDIAMRAKIDGLDLIAVPWDKEQVLHQWHVLSTQYHSVKSDFPNSAWGIVRNRNGWGEMPP
jgi:hypothetical protein